MKRKIKNIIISLVFLTSTTLALFLFIDLNSKRNIQALILHTKSFKAITELTAEMIASGYLQWNELYNALENNDTDFIQQSFHNILQMNKYIEEISIIDSNTKNDDPPYIIQNIEGSLYINFKPQNSNLGKYINDRVVSIKLNIDSILESIITFNFYSFTNGKNSHPFAYGLIIRSNASPIRFYQIVSAFSVGLLAALLLRKTFNSHSNYFYETRGLEKIIFLFEHTERYSANHSRHVATIAYILGRKYGYKSKDLKDLKVAALLHDIGKISIPREILNKKKKLTDKEFNLIKEHPILSENIIKNFEELSHLRPLIKHHHEKMDGSGYPLGLKGDKIPIQSRIIAVADIFEALTGERPYREPMSPKTAITFMETMSLDKYILSILDKNLDEICLKIDRSLY